MILCGGMYGDISLFLWLDKILNLFLDVWIWRKSALKMAKSRKVDATVLIQISVVFENKGPALFFFFFYVHLASEDAHGSSVRIVTN